MAASAGGTRIAIPAELLRQSSGLALDIGGSLAKIVYRSKEDYSNGEPIEPSQHPEGIGYVQVASFPKYPVDTYIEYIKHHVDLTGDPPLVNSCGFGTSEFRNRIEKDLNLKLNEIAEIQCNSTGIRTLMKDPTLTEHYNVFTEGIFEQCLTHVYRRLFFTNVTSGLTVPTKAEFEVKLRKAVEVVESMRAEELHLPFLVVMCGSACPFFIVHADGRAETMETTLLSGRCFHGMAAAMTGEKDWNAIQEMIASHDGGSAFSYFDCKHLNIQLDKIPSQDNTDEVDTAVTDRPSVRWIPFGNLPTSSRENECSAGDKAHTLFEVVCINLATLAYNVALANGMRQVLFCGSFGSTPAVKAIITRDMIMRNTAAYFKERMHRIIDFRFVRNGGHLCALGAFLANK